MLVVSNHLMVGVIWYGIDVGRVLLPTHILVFAHVLKIQMAKMANHHQHFNHNAALHGMDHYILNSKQHSRNYLLAVYRQLLEWIDGNQNITNICLWTQKWAVTISSGSSVTVALSLFLQHMRTKGTQIANRATVSVQGIHHSNKSNERLKPYK